MTFLRSVVVSLKSDLRFAGFSLAANSVAGSALVPRAFRVCLLRMSGIKVGRAHIASGIFFGGSQVVIGHKTLVNQGCWFDAHGITIGDNVQVGYQVAFVTATHSIGPSENRAGPNESFPVVVEDGCWIGARATIMPGVTIATGCVIGAGSLVSRSTEPDGLYVGVPARRVRDLD